MTPTATTANGRRVITSTQMEKSFRAIPLGTSRRILGKIVHRHECGTLWTIGQDGRRLRLLSAIDLLMIGRPHGASGFDG